MSQQALNHVISGDLTDKVFVTNQGRIVKKVISGGLHTYLGWLSFLKCRPEIRNLSGFFSARDSGWYYERELQNGTILLKLPESLLTSSAAKMTKFPEENYKSGYLWKTLFPKEIDSDELIELLSEALSNISLPESRDGEIICYYKLNEPLKCMRISVLYRNGEINSFYPTWSQPNTGNNGKPFSFFDNIGHVSSESSLVGNNKELNLTSIGLFSKLESFLDFPNITPRLFLDRKCDFSSLRGWERERSKKIVDYVDDCSLDQIHEIYNYVNDEAIIKHHDKAMQFAYENYNAYINLSEEFYNSISIHQNIIESIYLLFYFDQKNQSNLYSSCVLNLISNMFTSPLADMWVKKIIHHHILHLTLHYHNENFAAEYFDALAVSPTRREAFSEYLYESHDKKINYSNAKKQEDLTDIFCVISHPPQDKALTYSNFIHYFSDNLGESYSMHYSDEERKAFLLEAYPGVHYEKYIKGCIRFMGQDVFTSFPFYISCYFEHFKKNGVDKPLFIDRIVVEYFKLQVAQRHRINLNYAPYNDIAEFVTFPAKKEDVYSYILKHERIANRNLTDEIIESTKKYLSKVEDAKLLKILKDIESKDRKEIPRFPIPYSLILEMVRDPESINIQELAKMRFI
ncbi:hypothetical protein [Pantoea endophytica]